MPVIIWSDEIHLLMPITQAYPTLVVLGGLVLSVSVVNINMVCLSQTTEQVKIILLTITSRAGHDFPSFLRSSISQT